MKRTEETFGRCEGGRLREKMQGEGSIVTETLAMCCDLRAQRCDQQFKDMGQKGLLILQLPEEMLQGKLGSVVVKEISQGPK